MEGKVVIITDIPFWRHIAGHMARLTSLTNYLSKNLRLTIIYGGFVHKSEKEYLSVAINKFKLVTFNTLEFGLANFADFIKYYLTKNTFEICIIEYIELSFLLDSIPKNTKKYLDTHDLKSDRKKEFKKYGLPHEKFSWEEEINIFKQYDKILLIQKTEYKKVSRLLGKDKTLLISHAVNLPRQKIRKKVTNIGFIASSYPPNIEGLFWFLNNVWPSFRNYDIQLTIYGSVCNYFPRFDKYKNVCFKGLFNDLEDVYKQIDIAINPVRLGAGIKIKNLEALGSGIPLITLPHGAIGLEELANKGFLVAKDKSDFKVKLSLLIKDFNMRKSIADNGYKYISSYYSVEYCFKPLLNSILYH
jgi:glycosyltransferase involved in cell wall biosynthesis